MIPLALYSLDHPNAPMLMSDFRHNRRARQTELTRRAINDAMFGIAGVARFTNLPLLAGQMSYNFVRSRHGAAVDRAARRRSYAQLRYRLAFDQELTPALRTELQRRLNMLGLNPLGETIGGQRALAEAQHQERLRYARDPMGLTAHLELDRRAELNRLIRRGFWTTTQSVLSSLTFGLYNPREKPTPDIAVRLAAERRVVRHEEFLAKVAASRSISEVTWNAADIRRSLDVLTHADYPARSAPAVAQVFLESRDDQLRLSCLRALHRIGAEQSRAELQKLAANPKLDEQWRSLARGYAESPLSVPLDPSGIQDQIH